MTKIKNLEDLFKHEIKDLLSAETQLVDTVPKLIEKTNDKELKQAFENHLKDTKEQKKRLEKIVETQGISGSSTCYAMQGLIKESSHLISEDIDPEALDAGLIGAAQRILHYEVAGLGTVINYARMLGHQDAVDLLQKSLQEERNTDKKLTLIAERNINQKARGGRAA